MTSLSAEEIAPLSLHNPAHLSVQLNQTKHRIAIISKWNVSWDGAKVLEIGCGQGDCTAVLAEAVGAGGHVTAVDPAPLTYGKASAPSEVHNPHFSSDPFVGSPFTLGQAQQHLSSGRLGDRITWKQADPLQFLQSADAETYDVAVLTHCLWYFASPDQISQTLKLLAGRAKKICVAEWSLLASDPKAYPHVLATLAQAACECRKQETTSNVRTVVSPRAIKEIAGTVGLELQTEATLTPDAGVLDGRWEVSAALSGDFEAEIGEFVQEGRERGVLFAMRDALQASVASIGGAKAVMSMDVWAGVFAPSG